MLSDPKAVYDRIRQRHLVYGESADKRKLERSGHQFEPLFEASIAELESVGLGKSCRELYLSKLRKMPANLQKQIRSDKRLWPTKEPPYAAL